MKFIGRSVTVGVPDYVLNVLNFLAYNLSVFESFARNVLGFTHCRVRILNSTKKVSAGSNIRMHYNTVLFTCKHRWVGDSFADLQFSRLALYSSQFLIQLKSKRHKTNCFNFQQPMYKEKLYGFIFIQLQSFQCKEQQHSN